MNISFERGCHEGRFQASSATVEEIELESDHGFLVSAPFWQKTVTGNRGLSPKYGMWAVPHPAASAWMPRRRRGRQSFWGVLPRLT